MCRGNFNNIVIQNALRNDEVVLPGLQDVLMNYLKSDFPNLIKLSQNLLIDIGWNPAVKKHMWDKIESTFISQFQSVNMYDLTVDKLLASL